MAGVGANTRKLERLFERLLPHILAFGTKT